MYTICLNTCNMRSNLRQYIHISFKIISALLERGPSMELSLNYLKCTNYLNDIVSYVSCLVALPPVNSMICRWTNKYEGYGETVARYVGAAEPAEPALGLQPRESNFARHFMKQRRSAILKRQCAEYGNVGGDNETPTRRSRTPGSRTGEIRPNKGKRRATHVIPFNFTVR